MHKWQSPWNRKHRRRRRISKVQKIGSVFVSIMALMFGAHLVSARGDFKTAIGAIAGQCRIKGNISKRGGERIYHTSGQKYYLHSQINLVGGERWFCSEAKARAAG